MTSTGLLTATDQARSYQAAGSYGALLASVFPVFLPGQNGSAHIASPARPGLKEATLTEMANGWGSKGGVKTFCRAALSRHIYWDILPGHFVLA